MCLVSTQLYNYNLSLTNSRKICLQMIGLYGVVGKVEVARDQAAVGARLPQRMKHRVELRDA